MTKKTASEKETSDSPAERAEAKPEAKNKPQEKAGNKAETKAKAKPKTRRSKSKPTAKAREAATEPVKEEEQPSGPQAKASDAAAAEEKQAKPKTKRKPRGRAKKANPKQAPAQEAPPELANTPSEEAVKAEPQGQTDALPEAAAEPERKPKPRRKKKKKAKAEEAVTPAAEPEIAEQPVLAPTTKRGKKKPTPKKGGRAEREVKVGVERVVVASENPAKVKAVELGFARMFPGKEFVFEGMSADSGVNDQPMSDDETFAGALNRASTAREEQAEADYWIGLEGGLQEEGDDFFAFAWIVVLGPEGMQGKSRTGTFVIPPAVSELVRNGKELGEADDIVFSQTNSKQSSGAIGILTHGILDRANYYAEAVLMALIPFKNPSLYLLGEVIEIEED